MTELPDPPIPANCDLRDFPWMPFDLTRLFTSESWMLGNDAQRCAALRLWGASWHQVPAGSLPLNEKMLRILSERYDDWSKVREHALRGWIECSDGRLYHPVVAEKAMEAWNLKLGRLARTEAARQAKAAKRAAAEGSQTPPQATIPKAATEKVTDIATRRVTTSVTDAVTGSNRQDRTGQDQTFPPIAPPSAPQRCAASRGSHLTPEWEPGPDGVDFARSLGLDPQAVLAEFGDYWRSVPGAKGRKLDWTATWRNRCRDIAARRKTIPIPLMQARKADSDAFMDDWLSGFEPGKAALQ